MRRLIDPADRLPDALRRLPTRQPLAKRARLAGIREVGPQLPCWTALVPSGRTAAKGMTCPVVTERLLAKLWQGACREAGYRAGPTARSRRVLEADVTGNGLFPAVGRSAQL
jgi:hypothetical protein